MIFRKPKSCVFRVGNEHQLPEIRAGAAARAGACNTSRHGDVIGLGIVAFTLYAMRTLPLDRPTAGSQVIAAGSPVHRIPVGRLARPMRP